MATTKLQRLQRRLGDAATGKDELLIELIEGAELEMKAYCRRKTLPAEADSLVVKIALIDYNRLGTEGGQSQSFGGVTESWIDGYPKNIQAAINGYRVARFV